jgi:hypothetical protein
MNNHNTKEAISKIQQVLIKKGELSHSTFSLREQFYFISKFSSNKVTNAYLKKVYPKSK